MKCMKLLLLQTFPIYVERIDFVSAAIQEQNSLSIHLGTKVQSTKRRTESTATSIHDKKSSSLPCYDQREDKILNSHSKGA